MELLGNFFDKYRRFEVAGAAMKQLVARVIEQEVGVKPAIEDISIRNYSIFIKVPPIVRSEVLIKKERIMSQIRELAGKGDYTLS